MGNRSPELEVVMTVAYSGVKASTIITDPSSFTLVLNTLREDLTFLGIAHPKVANIRVPRNGSVQFSWITWRDSTLHKALTLKKSQATENDLRKLSIYSFTLVEYCPPRPGWTEPNATTHPHIPHVHPHNPKRSPQSRSTSAHSSSTTGGRDLPASPTSRTRPGYHPYPPRLQPTQQRASSPNPSPRTAKRLASEAETFLNNIPRPIMIKKEESEGFPSASSSQAPARPPAQATPLTNTGKPHRKPGESELEYEMRIWETKERQDKEDTSAAIEKLVNMQAELRKLTTENESGMGVPSRGVYGPVTRANVNMKIGPPKGKRVVKTGSMVSGGMASSPPVMREVPMDVDPPAPAPTPTAPRGHLPPMPPPLPPKPPIRAPSTSSTTSSSFANPDTPTTANNLSTNANTTNAGTFGFQLPHPIPMPTSNSSNKPSDAQIIRKLTQELREVRETVRQGLGREDAILRDLKRAGVSAPEGSSVSAAGGGGSEFLLKARLEVLEAELAQEKKRREEAENNLRDIQSECREPFVVPSLVDAFISVRKLANAVLPPTTAPPPPSMMPGAFGVSTPTTTTVNGVRIKMEPL